MTSPRRNRIDLHTHTTRSDGILSPTELLDAMAAWGSRVAAVTDHDTLAGYRELRAAGLTDRASGPLIVPGVEINAMSDAFMREHGLGRTGDELHVLGFGMDPDDEAFEAALETQRSSRENRVWSVVDRLREIGKPIDAQIAAIDSAGGTALGRPHVARAMIAAGYVASVEEAFSDWLGFGCPAFVPRLGLGPRDAIECIRRAGGVPVLAHSPAAAQRAGVIDRLVDWGLGGLEVYYRSFEPQVVAELAAFAEGRSLIATGGSDYHGDLVTYAESQATLSVPDVVGDALLAALR